MHIKKRKAWNYGRPLPPYTVNQDCKQAEKLVGWFPMLGLNCNTICPLTKKVMVRFDTTGLEVSNAPLWYPDPEMGWYVNFVAANEEHFKYSGHMVYPGNTIPLTMACWFNPNDITSSTILMSVVTDNQNVVAHRLANRGATAGDPISAQSCVGTCSSADTTTGFVASKWQHACGVWTTTTLRAAYLNGGSKGTNTSSRGPTFAQAVIGAYWANSAVGLAFDGKIAEARYYHKALNDQEVYELYDEETRWDLYYPLGRKVYAIPHATAAVGRSQVVIY